MRPVIKNSLIILVTALMVGGLTYYLVNARADADKADLQSSIDNLNKKVTDLTTDASTSSTATTPSTTTTTPDPTAGWQTYTSSAYGFTIKYPTDWKYLIQSPKVYFEPKSAQDANMYIEKYSGTLAAAATELKNRLAAQFGNACGGPDLTYSTTDVSKFGTTAKKVEVINKNIKDCEDGKVISTSARSVTQDTYAVTSSKGTLLIWGQEYDSTATGDTKITQDLSNSVIDTITLQ